MKFGIIAEGKGDCAVLRNILIGLGLIEKPSQVAFIRPKFEKDASDIKDMHPDEFSSWTLVKSECVSRHKFFEFFEEGSLDEKRKMIVHLDSAECELKGYDVKRPDKNSDNYCEILRNNIIEKIKEWLDNKYTDDTYFAIAIEETEAWVHALYENKDTSKSAAPKEAFSRYLIKNKIRVKSNNAYQRAKILSDDFTKINRKKVKGCLENNLSLKLFVESLPAPQYI
ncbi:MAG TPA: hypothetical protein ENJ95_08445 [Bacteroidetes bacterium]|nr:hypothetical protein [Bacteroidota bacterium]